MNLKDYLDEYEIGVRAFSRQNDISEMSVYNWVNGLCAPLKAYQKLIHRATDGKVTYKDWDELKFSDKRRKHGKQNINKGSIKKDGVHDTKRLRPNTKVVAQGKKTGR